MHVTERAIHVTVRFLRQHAGPISVEALAERISYSYPHTNRILAALRSSNLITSSRPERSRALEYHVNEETARRLGLL